MLSRALLVIFIFILWSAGSGYYYVCHIKQACGTEIVEAEVNNEPLSFKISDQTPIIGTDFEAWKLEVLAGETESTQLKLIGLYGASEVNNTLHDDLGIARAIQVQEALGLNVEDVIIESELAELDWSETTTGALKFEWTTKQRNVVKNDFGAVVALSPYAVPEDIPDDIRSYINELCNNTENQVIDIVGYSTELNDVAENYSQGYQAANLIRDLMADNGYPLDLLNVTSEGSTGRENLNTDAEMDSLNLVELIVR